jgi:hypothetical protein
MKKFILFLTFFCSYSFAQIDKYFKEYFYEGELSARHCGQNISNFIQYLAKNNFKDVTNIDVVSMTSPSHPWSFGRVVSIQSRWSDKAQGEIAHQNFDFHVFAIYKGLVYDFHFTKEPTVVPLDEYLERMYVPSVGFAINGSSFRVRGMGPIYTPQHALDELKDSNFKMSKSNSRGDFILQHENVSYDKLLNDYFRNVLM